LFGASGPRSEGSLFDFSALNAFRVSRCPIAVQSHHRNSPCRRQAPGKASRATDHLFHQPRAQRFDLLAKVADLQLHFADKILCPIVKELTSSPSVAIFSRMIPGVSCIVANVSTSSTCRLLTGRA
jgi:hypothetical protein